MIEPTELDRIKTQIAIADVLAARGYMPIVQRRDELAYHSPLRDDTRPSFFVNTQANVFKDQVVSEHRGDVIRLVQLLDGVGFAQAVQTLHQFENLPDRPCFFLSGSSLVSPTRKETIREVKFVQNPALLRYAESRGIRVGLTRTYLREVHYQHNERYLYALGFANDSGGYALRNGVGCKRTIGPADLTTIAGTRPQSEACHVFEGFFDFLAALQYYGLSVPSRDTYVLNSVSNLHRVLPHLSHCTHIHVFFDRDKAGRDAFGTLRGHNLPVIDRSELYQRHTDFNEFLVKSGQPKLSSC